MKAVQPVLSVVSPVYQAAEIVPVLVARICAAAERISPHYEVLLVEDGSPDDSWVQIERICRENPRIKGIKLSRNYGQHRAISAGIAAAKGQYVAVIDCDLQDNPDYLPAMYQKALEGYDIVFARRRQRSHPGLKNLLAGIFYLLFRYLADDARIEPGTGAYTLLSRKVADAFCLLQDSRRQYLLLLNVLGFRRAYVEVVHEARYSGRSTYTLGRMWALGLDAITSHSDKLLRLSAGLGLFMFVISILAAVALVVKKYLIGAEIGWTSLMVLITCATGLILMAIGIMGIYIGRIFEQVKARPLYLVDQTLNMEPPASGQE